MEQSGEQQRGELEQRLLALEKSRERMWNAGLIALFVLFLLVGGTQGLAFGVMTVIVGAPIVLLGHVLLNRRIRAAHREETAAAARRQ